MAVQRTCLDHAVMGQWRVAGRPSLHCQGIFKLVFSQSFVKVSRFVIKFQGRSIWKNADLPLT